MKEETFVIGVDFGTDSVRSIIADTHNGNEVASAVFQYPRWHDGLYCDPAKNQFRQHPLDYIEGLESSIKQCVLLAGKGVAPRIKAISIDTTGSSPVAVNEHGFPLALLPAFENNPNAMFVLWKDHTAIREAEEINVHAKKFAINYLQYVGGIYSSEWFWAKLLHVLRNDKLVRQSCYSWVEHCDWIPFLLTGKNHISQMKRSVCAAGHKALWSEEYNGLPPENFFSSLDPLLNCFRSRMFEHAYTADKPTGNISKNWAEKLGLSQEVIIGAGAFDAHMGAVGGQIEAYHLSKVMGTSTCDMLVAPIGEVKGKLIKGICGQVPGSVIPGMMGMEAGQSAFGDAYAWFSRILSWPLERFTNESALRGSDTGKGAGDEISNKIIADLSISAAQLSPDDASEIASDWLNGRRSPDANQLLTGGILGLNLGSTAPSIFRALVESTCFGAKAIVDRFNNEGVRVKGLIGLGGVAKKSPFIMQMMADVMNMPIRIHRSEQTCALGAAMFAATASGIYPKVEEAMAAMGQGFDKEYVPNNTNVELYLKRYLKYQKLGSFIEQETTY
jgi:L-ribulokinase